MAIKVTSSVPTKIGTAPKEPELPTWSARSAVCGLQCRPKRNSWGGTRSKKRPVSKISERTIPTVTSTASVEHSIRPDPHRALDLRPRGEAGRDRAQRERRSGEAQREREAEGEAQPGRSQRRPALGQRRSPGDRPRASTPRPSAALRASWKSSSISAGLRPERAVGQRRERQTIERAAEEEQPDEQHEQSPGRALHKRGVPAVVAGQRLQRGRAPADRGERAPPSQPEARRRERDHEHRERGEAHRGSGPREIERRQLRGIGAEALALGLRAPESGPCRPDSRTPRPPSRWRTRSRTRAARESRLRGRSSRRCRATARAGTCPTRCPRSRASRPRPGSPAITSVFWSRKL